MPFVIDKFKSKTELQYQKNSPYLTEVQWDISDLPLMSAFANKIVKDTLIKLKTVAKLHIKTLRYKIIIWKALGVP